MARGALPADADTLPRLQCRYGIANSGDSTHNLVPTHLRPHSVLAIVTNNQVIIRAAQAAEFNLDFDRRRRHVRQLVLEWRQILALR